MKKIIVVITFITISVIVISVFILEETNNYYPEGWFPAGNNSAEYEMGIDSDVIQNGSSSAFIRSISPDENEFGTLMQKIMAEDYAGKRLKLSGYIRTENVEGWSGMWMRIDGQNREKLGFDNMMNRAITGTSDWNKYDIVLDIPLNSGWINYGELLAGEGTVWFDNFSLSEVDRSVTLTSIYKNNSNESGLRD